MLTDFLQVTPLALMAGVIATVYMLVLPGERYFAPWFRWGASVGIRPDGSRLWWYKPLFECEKCMAGQIGLWWYLIDRLEMHTGPVWFYLFGNQSWPIRFVFILPHEYDLISHAYAATGSILAAMVISRLFINFLNR